MDEPTPRPTRRQALTDLRTILVELFFEPKRITTVAEEAGLEIARIDFAGASIDVWEAVLAQAAREHKVKQVTEVAATYYSENRERLLDAAAAYESALPDPVDLRPRLIAAVAVLGVMLVGIYLWITQPWVRIEPMSDFGDFNLAVSRFPVVDATGRMLNDCVGDRVNLLLDDTLRRPAGIVQKQIVDDFRGPDAIGVTDDAQAAQLAKQINATVLVYGVITATEYSYAFQPAFYVQDTARVFDYGGELAGPNQLGQPVSFALPSTFDCDTLSDEDLGIIDRALRDRLTLLGNVIAGLGYYFQEEYLDAAYWFNLSTRQSQRQDDPVGQSVTEMLLGAARLREATPADPANQAEKLVAAEQAFLHSVELAPDYSRAYLGLGITALERAKVYDQRGVDVIAIHPAELVTSTNAFSLALTAADQPPQAYVPAKAALGIGIAHLLGAEFGVPGWSFAEAANHFDVVTATLAANDSDGIKSVAALAYGYLGKIAAATGDWEAMKDNCQQTIQLLAQAGAQPDARTTAEAWGCIANADLELGNLCDAYVDLESALTIGSRQRADSTVIPTAKLDLWSATRETLRSKCGAENEQL